MSIWEQLTTKKPENLAKNVITQYRENRDNATRAVIQLIVNACGCQYKVDDMEVLPNLLSIIENEAPEQHGGFPLMKNKNLCAKFVLLMESLVRKCENSVLYDQYLMHILCRFLCDLSASGIRGFRHCGTVAGLSVTSELARVCNELNMQKINLEQQLPKTQNFSDEAEIAQYELIHSSVNELSENIQEASNLMKRLIKKILLHRIRDVAENIRMLCCKKLKLWMEEYPDIFLSDEFYKLVYDSMHDPSGDIRRTSLKIVEWLTLSGETNKKIENFLSCSKERLVLMSLDVNTSVAVQAVKVLALIDKSYDHILDQNSKESIFLLVFSKHREVAKEAAAYTLQVAESKMEDGSSLLENIVCFFMESSYPEHAYIFVDSLWDLCSELTEWKVLIQFFLRQTVTETKLATIKIIQSSVHKAVTGETPRPKINQEHFHEPVITIEKSKTKMMEENRKEVTEVFMIYIPKMIALNMEDDTVLCYVLKLPLYFQNEIYANSIYQEMLEKLLESLKEVIIFSNNETVLNSCVEIYKLLQSIGLPTNSTTNTRISVMIDVVVDKYKEAMENLCQTMQHQMPSVDEVYTTERWATKLSCLSKCIDIRIFDIYQEMVDYMTADITDQLPIPEEIECCMLRSCFHGLLFGIDKAVEYTQSGEDIKSLRDDLEKYFEILTSFLSSELRNKAQQEAFKIFCELVHTLCIHSNNYPNIGTLVYIPDAYINEKLQETLRALIFVQEDVTDELLQENSLDARKQMLRGYWKLLSCHALPLDSSCFIFDYYILFPEYKDFMEEMLKNILEYDAAHCVNIVVVTLLSIFNKILNGSTSATYESLKEMSHKFAGILKQNNISREAVKEIHKKAIGFITVHGDWRMYHFLEVISEFSEITHASDANDIIKYLHQNIPFTEKERRSEVSTLLKQYTDALLSKKKTPNAS